MSDKSRVITDIKRHYLKQGLKVDEQALMGDLEDTERKLALYKRVFLTEDGKEVLKDLMREGGILEGSPGGDTATISFQEGKRCLVVYIANLANLTFEDIITLNFSS